MSDTSDYESRIDPEQRALLVPEMFGFFEKIFTDLAETRSMFGQIQEMGRAMLPAFDGSEDVITIPGLDGQPDVKAHIYRQNACSHPQAILIWLHGGGYVFGSANETSVRRFTPICTVVSVEYRMAPEHRSPAAALDTCAVIAWAHDNADVLGFDRSKIMVGGPSAGGGLAASAAQLNRDRGGPPLAWQLLIYPMLDDRHDNAAGQQDIPRWLWHRELSLYAWSLYAEEGGASPYAAAMRGEDLTGLPPACLVCGDLDLFRDDTIAYAQRLMQAGIPVELSIQPGGVHGFDVFAPDSQLASRANALMSAALRQIVGR